MDLGKLKTYFASVEDILQTFSREERNNYYNNKQFLKIDFLAPNGTGVMGNYNPVDNIITVYNSSSIYHELFHMAFTDRRKLNKKIFPDLDIYFDNGISFRTRNEIVGKGLTEGFAEYLARKVTDSKGNNFNYYFADLFISVYGEEIIGYA